MAKLRPGRCIRDPKRAYTRVSKYKKLSYVKSSLGTKIVQFVSGNPNGKFNYSISVLSSRDIVIRDNAIEAARVAANKILSSKLSDENFLLVVKQYPHHFIREHKLAAVAQADRFWMGMSLSFGKVAGRAVRVNTGAELFRITVDESNAKVAEEAAKAIEKKLGFRMLIIPNYSK
ncbi:MAG: 50S ribosomal protein L16 [Candidatus Rehaiarchaeum fermentans]|nr:50S ribosomal protein L16 [Candidatus Rehaiarchaeum fermentans]